MSISFDKALGVHEKALSLHAKRTELLAANLANADTPNYKARDIDFKSALAQARDVKGSTGMQTTHSRHISTESIAGLNAQVLYRTPSQPSLDGNTVDTEVEKAEFAQNSINYMSSMRFVDGKLKGLIKALRGE